MLRRFFECAGVREPSQWCGINPNSQRLRPARSIRGFHATMQSLMAASQELHVTPSALSRTIKQLEDELGVTPTANPFKTLAGLQSRQVLDTRLMEALPAAIYTTDAEGRITEGTSTNAWIVTADDLVLTRRPDHAILNGEEAIEISASADDRATAVLDVFKQKLVKRNVSLKVLDASEPKQSGQQSKIGVALKEGITSEDAKKVGKLIRDEGPKGVKVQVQGDELRVSSKKRDDLQAVIALVKEQDYDFAVQFTNYR